MYDDVARRKKLAVEVIDLALTAKLGNLSAVVCTQHHMVTDIKVAGLFPKFWLFCFLVFFIVQLVFVVLNDCSYKSFQTAWRRAQDHSSRQRVVELALYH